MMSTSRFWKLMMAVAATTLSTAAFAASAMAALPQATTGEATNVTATRATLHGSVAFQGANTVYAFFAHPAGEECGDPEPCYSTTVEVLSGESPAEVVETIKGLEPETSYEYLLAALDLESGELSEGEAFEITTGSRNETRFEAGEYPAAVSGEQDVEVEFGITGGVDFLKCSTALLDTSAADVTSALELSADYSGCKLGTNDVSVEMNSCSYVTTLDAGGPPYTAGYGVACDEEGDAIDITVFTFSGGVLCPVTIPAQGAGGALSVTEDGEGANRTVDVEGTATGVNYTTPEEQLGCELMGLEESGEDGYFEVDASLEAQDGGESVGLFVTGGEADVGLFVAGEESEEEAGQPHFAAELYPAGVSGEQNVETEFGVVGGGAKLKCDTVLLDGSIAEATSSLDLSADYADCKVGTRDASVEMNSCNYTVSLDNSGPPYAGGYGIECDEEGDAIEFAFSNIAGSVTCTVEIGPQAVAQTLGLATKGLGNAGKFIEAEGTVGGVEYTASENLLCQLSGLKVSGEDGYFDVGASLYGEFPG